MNRKSRQQAASELVEIVLEAVGRVRPVVMLAWGTNAGGIRDRFPNGPTALRHHLHHYPPVADAFRRYSVPMGVGRGLLRWALARGRERPLRDEMERRLVAALARKAIEP